MNGVNVLVRQDSRGRVFLCIQYEDTAGGWMSPCEQVGPHQTINLPTLYLGYPGLQICEKFLTDLICYTAAWIY